MASLNWSFLFPARNYLRSFASVIQYFQVLLIMMMEGKKGFTCKIIHFCKIEHTKVNPDLTALIFDDFGNGHILSGLLPSPITCVAHTFVPSTSTITLLEFPPTVSLNAFLHSLPAGQTDLSGCCTHSFTRFPLQSKMGRWRAQRLDEFSVLCKQSRDTRHLLEGSVMCPDTYPPGLPCSHRLRVSNGRELEVTVMGMVDSLLF